MAKFRNPVSWETAWVLILGIGIGVLIGVLFASGIGFSKEDGARFVGALFGSLIAVAGAVSLHFLKEAGQIKNRRARLISLLEQLKKFNNSVRKDVEAGDPKEVRSQLRVTNRFMLLCKRYCSSHMSEDFNVSMVSAGFDNITDDYYLNLLEDDDNLEEISKKILELIDKKTEHIDFLINLAKDGLKP